MSRLFAFSFLVELQRFLSLPLAETSTCPTPFLSDSSTKQDGVVKNRWCAL